MKNFLYTFIPNLFLEDTTNLRDETEVLLGVVAQILT